jgi:hypothetical protein
VQKHSIRGKLRLRAYPRVNFGAAVNRVTEYGRCIEGETGWNAKQKQWRIAYRAAHPIDALGAGVSDQYEVSDEGGIEEPFSDFPPRSAQPRLQRVSNPHRGTKQLPISRRHFPSFRPRKAHTTISELERSAYLP